MDLLSALVRRYKITDFLPNSCRNRELLFSRSPDDTRQPFCTQDTSRQETMLPTGKENYSSPSHILMIQEEKPLKFYKHYTLHNCLMECHANYTLIHCGCNMYFQVGLDRTNLGNDYYMTLCFSQEERAIHFAVPSSYLATKKL